MIFEFRTYQASGGAVDRLHERFATRTKALFERHGIDVLEFWVEVENPTRLHYLVQYADDSARLAAWENFRNDPEWHEVKRVTEQDGPLVETISKLLMRRTDYSPGRTGMMIRGHDRDTSDNVAVELHVTIVVSRREDRGDQLVFTNGFDLHDLASEVEYVARPDL